MDLTTPLRTAIEVHDDRTNANPPRTEAEAVELTIDGLQWMLLHSAVRTVEYLAHCKAHSASCEVWLNAYEAAPESVRESLTRSGMTNVWAPAIEAALENTEVDLDDLDFNTPLDVNTPLGAFVRVTKDDKLSNAAIKRLFQVLQRCGLIAAADRAAVAKTLYFSACDRLPRAFALLIAEPSADAALSGPTRCSAGDAHNPPRHHSVEPGDDDVTVHDVLYDAARDPVVWRAFSDARLPFGTRAMDEEWTYELTGPCGCAGVQRIRGNPLHYAINFACDKAGEWLAARLPPQRLNAQQTRSRVGPTPLIAALRSDKPMPRTVAALLSRVPDVDLTRRWRFVDGKQRNAAEWIARHAPKWLPPRLAAELKLKTEQFGPQYPPSAAVLCTEQLFVQMGVPRELVRLILQYTALPQPHLWLNARSVAASGGTADESLMFGLTHRPAKHNIAGRKRGRDTAFGASTAL